jgi:hypothetical protein
MRIICSVHQPVTISNFATLTRRRKFADFAGMKKSMYFHGSPPLTPLMIKTLAVFLPDNKSLFLSDFYLANFETDIISAFLRIRNRESGTSVPRTYVII